MPPSVDALRAVGLLSSVAAARNNRQRTIIRDLLAYFLAIVGFIGGHSEWGLGGIQHLSHHLAVMNLSSGHDEVQRPAFAVDNGVDFAGPAAAADPDRLIFLPPFAPAAAR